MPKIECNACTTLLMKFDKMLWTKIAPLLKERVQNWETLITDRTSEITGTVEAF